MSGQDSGNKSELPTSKKLKDAKKEGNFQFSNITVLTANLVIMGFVLMIFLKDLPFKFDRAFSASLRLMQQDYFPAAVFGFLKVFIQEAVWISGLILIAGAVVSWAANLMQVGFVFQGSKFKKGLDAMNPVNNLKNLFSKKSLTQLLTNIVITLIVLYVSYTLFIKDVGFSDRIYAHGLDLFGAMAQTFQMVAYVGIVASVSLVPVAAMDFFLQHKFYIKDNMMAKHEIEKEHKETEGDPHVKGKRKQVARELVEGGARISGASAVIRNPTHYAIVIRYEPTLSPMPYIIQMGHAGEALEILAECAKHQVPEYVDIPLARALYANAKVNEVIPLEYAEPITDVLAWLINKHPERIYRESEFSDIFERLGNLKNFS